MVCVCVCVCFCVHARAHVVWWWWRCVCVCVCVCDRQTDRQSDRHTETERETPRERQRQRETETERQIYREGLGGHGWGGVQSSLNLVIYKKLTIPHVLNGLYERMDHPFTPTYFFNLAQLRGSRSCCDQLNRPTTTSIIILYTHLTLGRSLLMNRLVRKRTVRAEK